MSEYTDQLATGATGNKGVGVAFRPAVSDVFGHSGLGVRLATNFLLVLLDEFGRPVDAGLPYTLAYYNPATQQQVVRPLFHNPAIPYQASLPENQAIYFTLDPNNAGRYTSGQTAETIIGTNLTGVLQVRLAYPSGSVYARYTRKRFL